MRTLLISVVLCAAGGNVRAGGVITDGNALLQFVDSPIWSAPLGNGTLLTDAGGTDQLYKDTWYYRTQAGVNRPFSSLQTPTESYQGNEAQIAYPYGGGGFGSTEAFIASFSIRLYDSPTPGQVMVWTELRFRAHFDNSGPATFQLFHLVDLDLLGSAGNDAAATLSNSAITVRQSDATAFADVFGAGASRYEINTGAALRSKLNSGLANLDTAAGTTAPPKTGDMAAALQWTVTLNPYEEVVIQSAYTIGRPIPAPATVALATIAGLASMRRRR